MPENRLTIAVLAGLDVDASKSGLTKAARKALAKKLAAEAHALAALKPYDVGPRMVELLGDALREPLTDVLGAVWKQRRELREATSKSENGKPRVAEVDLIDHKMTWTLKPSITVSVSTLPKAPSVTVAVNANVSLRLQGVQIVIDRARITKIKAGKLSSKVELSYGELELMKPYETVVDLGAELELPGGGIDLS